MFKIVTPVLESWKQNAVMSISIELASRGCEGNSLVIHENTLLPTYVKIATDDSYGIDVYVPVELKDRFESGVLSRGKSGWILTHSDILIRCGCGKSFSFKSGNIKEDKLKLLRSKLARKTSHH